MWKVPCVRLYYGSSVIGRQCDTRSRYIFVVLVNNTLGLCTKG